MFKKVDLTGQNFEYQNVGKSGRNNSTYGEMTGESFIFLCKKK
jgi:hypothetical protein